MSIQFFAAPIHDADILILDPLLKHL